MKNLHEFNKLLTLQEVAKILRINRSSVSRLLKNRDLSYVQIGSRKLVDESDLILFLDKQKVKGAENGCSLGE